MNSLLVCSVRTQLFSPGVFHPISMFTLRVPKRNLDKKKRRLLERSRSKGDDVGDIMGVRDDIPDFDDLVLDDKFYEEIGESREHLEKYPPWAPEAIDPKGFNVDFNGYIQHRTDIPDYIKTDLKEAQYFGPPMVIVAGFRLEELPMIRVMIDQVIGTHVKMIPVKGKEMLNMRVEDILELPETEWEKPRPSEDLRGGIWGSQRTIMFSGLTMDAQGALVEVIEDCGLPPVCCAIASKNTKDMLLGEVLADAIKFQRDRKNPEKESWEIEGRTVNDVSDLKSFMNDQIMERMKTVEKGLSSGEAKLKESKDGTLQVEMEGLDEQIFDPEKFTSSANQKKEPAQSKQSKEGVHAKVAEGKIGKRVEDSDEENDKILMESGIDSLFSSGQLEEDDLEDYFTVDDLVSDVLGEDKSDDETKKVKKAEPVSSEDQEVEEGNLYHLSTEPVEIDENVKRSTVFNGLVKDSKKFMKENFGYSAKTEDFNAPAGQDGDVEYIDITNTEDQEAFNEILASNGIEQQEETTVEDVIQEAVEKGLDPTYLKQVINSMSSSEATTTTPSKPDRPQFKTSSHFLKKMNKKMKKKNDS